MEIRQLRYFIAVADERHITRAAERLNMQQPPLSRQIKAMERELDVQLFHRKARGVELTDAGRALLDDARAIVARLDHAFETTRRCARGEQGRVCVGITSSSSYHPFVPQVIRAYRETFPLISLTLEEQHNSALIDGLRSESIDVAFVRTAPADRAGLVVNRLLAEPMVIALPRGHLLARRYHDTAIPLKALANETFVAVRPPNGVGLSDSTLAAYQAAGFSPRIGQEAPRITSMLNLVAAGLGISFVPASMQRMDLDGVIYRPLRGAAQLSAPLSLVARRTDTSAVVRRLVVLVKKAALNFAGP